MEVALATADRATSAALEFPSLLRVVSRLAATDLGRARILDLRPLADEDALVLRQGEVEEVGRLLVDGSLVPSLDLELAPLVQSLLDPDLETGGVELLRLASALTAVRQARERILADEGCQRLRRWVTDLDDLSPLVTRIRRSLDRRGDVRDDASPRLGSLRKRVRGVRGDLYDRLRGVVAEHGDELAEETIPLRGGRLVVMLRSGSKGRLKGLVHGRSGTGRSFYFEPLDVVDGNNALQQALEDESAERVRILAELTTAVRESRAAVEAHVEVLGDLDVLQAGHRFGALCDGRLARLAPRHSLRLRSARHPLLDPSLAGLREVALGRAGHAEPVVPLDLELSSERRLLVVTGPNAGGKTVALKTLGLVAMASQCGLPVPVGAGTELPVFSSFVATVGDDQDLLTDRSTFSGRLVRLREAWEVAGEDSLVLLDELGSGTDPEEGAALSIALVEGLLDRRSMVLATTHLTAVAAAALEREGAFCAAMEFDPRTGEPTFRLAPGPPGGSEALALARRLGLPEAWLRRAEEMLGPEHRELRRLLSEVETLRGELAERNVEAEERTAELARLQAEVEGERENLEAERVKVGRRMESELEAFRRRVRDRLGGEVDRLRSELEEGRRKGLAAASTERLFGEAPSPPASEPERELPIELGGGVRHRALGWTGILKRVDRGKAVVDVQGKTLRCRTDELVGTGADPGERRSGKGSVRVEAASDTPPARELNLIGRRVEEGIAELDAWLDGALLNSLDEIRVVHGHGSGRLRDSVRQHLRRHPAVVTLRPGRPDEGGDGATVIRLQEA